LLKSVKSLLASKVWVWKHPRTFLAPGTKVVPIPLEAGHPSLEFQADESNMLNFKFNWPEMGDFGRQLDPIFPRRLIPMPPDANRHRFYSCGSCLYDWNVEELISPPGW